METRNAEPDFRLLFESTPGLYLVLLPDEFFTIVAVSDSYAETTMTRRQEIIGKGLFELFPDNSDADGVFSLRASLQSVIKNRKRHLMETRKNDIKNKEGRSEVRYWSTINSPVFNRDGELIQIIHRVVDITEKHELKLRSEELIKELKAANQELESFSYSVSHDLRAPLRAVTGYAQILKEDFGSKLDQEGHRILDAIRYNSQKMGKLIDDLLNFSKLERKDLQRSFICMNELTEGVIMDINKLLVNNCEIRVGKLHSIRADYGLMHQVMFNLIANAVKYSSRKMKPMIEISSEETEGTITYLVRDNGDGFDMKHYGRLFRVFQRLHSQSEFEGTGVGLAIVHRIISKHGGKVWAEGKRGEGALFKFSLSMNQD